MASSRALERRPRFAATVKPYAATTNGSESWRSSPLSLRFCPGAILCHTRLKGLERVLLFRCGGKTSPIRLNKSPRKKPRLWHFDWPGRRVYLLELPPAATLLRLCD